MTIYLSIPAEVVVLHGTALFHCKTSHLIDPYGDQGDQSSFGSKQGLCNEIDRTRRNENVGNPCTSMLGLVRRRCLSRDGVLVVNICRAASIHGFSPRGVVGRADINLIAMSER